MKRICLFVNLLLIVFAGIAQQSKQSNLSKTLVDSLKMYPLHIIPSDYYKTTLGFFCIKELQIEKATKIPLRIRLGSLEYTDYLEQKPNAIKKP